MKSIARLFGSEARLKAIRLFVFNPTSIYNAENVSERIKERRDVSSKELRSLLKVGLIRQRVRGFVLNTDYIFLPALKAFLLDATPFTEAEILKKFTRAGNLKLVLLSGSFLHNDEARADLLVVADKLKPRLLLSVISSIEAELGKEIRYCAFETSDFNYRLGLHDKLVYDILEHKHKKILNKLGL